MADKADKRLWAGHCWLCGKRLMDIREVWPQDHLLDGQPRSFGAPAPDVLPKRVTFIRVSGRLTDITLCKNCEPTPDRMSELSSVLNLRYRIEDSDWWREAAGKKPDKESQRLRRLRVGMLYHHDALLGELARRPLTEVL
jgi:hypothetical protein